MDPKNLLRTGITRGIEKGSKGIDRAYKHDKGQGVILGYGVISKGKMNEEDVRGWEFDDESLDQIIEMGNANKMGVKSRFGHPNMSNTALGTFLGRAKNFRKDGDIVRADLYFDSTAYKTPNGDLGNYVLDLAESDPGAFGTSIVFLYELEYRLEKDGTRKKNKEGKEMPPLVRFTKLFASDVVDNPAANKSMFGQFFSDSVKPSAEMTSFLDRFLQNPDAINMAASFLQKYQVNGESIDTKTKKEEKSMDYKELSLDVLKKERADLVEVLHKEGFEAGKEGVEKVAKEAALKAERERVVGILKKASAYENMGELVSEVIEAGDSLETAETKFKAKKLDILGKGAPASPGPGSEEVDESLAGLTGEALWKKEFEKSAELQAEFGEESTYIAFKKNEASGAAQIFKGKQ